MTVIELETKIKADITHVSRTLLKELSDLSQCRIELNIKPHLEKK